MVVQLQYGQLFTVTNGLFCMYLCISMSQIMKHHGCRSHMMNQNNLTGQEDRFDLVVDSNDAILERVVRSSNLNQCFFRVGG